MYKRQIIDQAYEKAQEIINRYREKLDLLAQRLVEKEVLEREEIEQILDFYEENESSALPLQTRINSDLAGGEKTDEI